ncbi:MAG: hypothetical protein V1760_00630, partial [Candidatus Peregrinibacteria bacterium]
WNEFKKLTSMFEAIIMETEGGGKQDFLAIFPMLYQGHPERLTRTENRDQEAVARSIYNVIKEEIKQREAIDGATKRGEPEVLAKLEGMNIGDKILDTGRGVLDMVLSGDPVRMAAGIGVFFGLYKGVSHAIKGKGPMADLLRIGGIGLIAEVTMKELTGRGILDRTGAFDTLGEAIEGTYEAVLVQQGDTWMKEKGIDKDQHTAALYELNPVPFDLAVQWYNGTDSYGNQLPGNKSDSLWKRMGMDVGRINCNRKIRGAARSEEGEAKFIVKRAMENFFRHVSDKDGYTDMDQGRFALEERWIQAIKDPTFTLEKAKSTRFLWSKDALQRLRANPRAITWQMVRNAEIDVSEVEKTVGQNWKDQLADKAAGAVYDVYRWGRNVFDSYISPTAEDFFHTVGNKADDIKKWIGEMGEAGAVKLHFAKESVELWYGANKYTIRHFIGDHVEMVVEGVKLPLQILYGFDQWLVPLTTTTIRRFRESFRTDTLVGTKSGELSLADIGDTSKKSIEDIMDPATNPGWAFFGFYQQSFERAFNNGTDYDEVNDLANPKDYRIGYFISRVKKEDVGWTTTTDNADMLWKMDAKSYEIAIAKFMKEGGLNREQVIGLMYPIHVAVNRGSSSIPDEMYTFWRMPLPGSTEYLLKTSGENRWTDYMNPNKHKYRPPFLIDPSLSIFENVKRAAGLHLEATRVVSGDVGKFFAQWIRVALWMPAKAAETLKGFVGLIPPLQAKIGSAMIDIEKFATMDQDNKEKCDEFLTNAETGGAISDFYKKPINAWWYKAAISYSRNYVNVHGTSMPLYLGTLDSPPAGHKGEGFSGTRTSDLYKTRPSGWDDESFYRWVKTTFEPKNRKP